MNYTLTINSTLIILLVSDVSDISIIVAIISHALVL